MNILSPSFLIFPICYVPSLNFTVCLLLTQYFIEQDLALFKDNYIFFLKTGGLLSEHFKNNKENFIEVLPK